MVGKTYAISAEITGEANANELAVGVGAGSESSYSSGWGTGSPVIRANFVAQSTTTAITCYVAPSTGVAYFDNISCKLVDPDRSVKNLGLTVNGTLFKAPVASGAQLVGYSGFSASNYLERPYNSALDFGTGDFCVMGWANLQNAGGAQSLFDRGDVSKLRIWAAGDSGYLCCSIAGTNLFTANGSVNSGVWTFMVVTRIGGVVAIYLNAVSAVSGSLSGNIGTGDAVQVGRNANGGTKFALIRVDATVPSVDQIAHIYRTERELFQPDKQCTIDGNSTAVTALAYDETTDVLQVGTSWGRSAFRDLVRIESAVSTVGAITSLSANQGAHITGGASAGRYYQPAMLLRDELRRKEEARKALGKVPVFFEFDAVTSQTAFVLPKGYTTKAVYSAGSLKRVGATKDYTLSFDGFAETVNFGVAPGNTTWVSIMAVRGN